MLFVDTFINGYETVIMRADKNVEDRLRRTCFRGPRVKRAGNFSQWDSLEQLLRDPDVQKKFMFHIESLWKKRQFGRDSFEIQYHAVVGWSESASSTGYDPFNLEKFQWNRDGWGKRVKEVCKNLPAPQTDCFTIVFRLTSDHRRPVVYINSLHLGPNYWPPKGDVTERTQLVFFGPQHLGA